MSVDYLGTAAAFSGWCASGATGSMQQIIYIQGALSPCREARHNTINFEAKQGDRENAALRHTHLLLVDIRQSRANSYPKLSVLQKLGYECGQVASQTRLKKI